MRRCWEATIGFPKKFRKFNATHFLGLAETRKWLGEVKLLWLTSPFWFTFVLTCAWLALRSHALWVWIQLTPLAKPLTFWWVGAVTKFFFIIEQNSHIQRMIQNRSRLCSCDSFNPQRVHFRRKCFPSSLCSAPTLSLLLLLWPRLSSDYFNRSGLPLEVAPRHMQIIKGMKEQVNLLFRLPVLCGLWALTSLFLSLEGHQDENPNF